MTVSPSSDQVDKQDRALRSLVAVNLMIWMISIIALVFVIQDYPGAKGLAPILLGGCGTGVAILSVLRSVEKD